MIKIIMTMMIIAMSMIIRGNNYYNDVMMIKIMNKYHFQYLPKVS